MSMLVLALPSPCPRSAQSPAHTWQSSDSADLISFSEPDHGLSMYLRRCCSCAVPLLTVVPLLEGFCGGGAVLEVHGA